MNRTTQLVVFCLLLMFLGFCAGMYVSSFFISGDSGLAGPAIAFGYGIAGMVICLMAGIISGRKMKQPVLRNSLIVAGIFSVILVGWIILRLSIIMRQTSMTGKTDFSFHYAGFRESQVKLPAGEGITKPHLIPGKPLYFYSPVSLDASADKSEPVDSVTFVQGEHFIDIATAPPWLVPEFLKLDYDIFFLRTLTLSKNWLEVIVNNTSGQTAWIDANDVDFIGWQRFLLDIASVEVIDPGTNPLRIKPLEHASILAEPPIRFALAPIAIPGEWMMVSTLGLADRIEPTGWIRWKKDDQLLIRFSPLTRWIGT